MKPRTLSIEIEQKNESFRLKIGKNKQNMMIENKLCRLKIKVDKASAGGYVTYRYENSIL